MSYFSILFLSVFRSFSILLHPCFFTQITQHRPGIQLRFLHSYQRGKTAPTVAGSATIYPLPVSWYPLKIAPDRFFAKTPNFQRDMDVSSTEKRAPRKARIIQYATGFPGKRRKVNSSLFHSTIFATGYPSF